MAAVITGSMTCTLSGVGGLASVKRRISISSASQVAASPCFGFNTGFRPCSMVCPQGRTQAPVRCIKRAATPFAFALPPRDRHHNATVTRAQAVSEETSEPEVLQEAEGEEVEGATEEEQEPANAVIPVAVTELLQRYADAKSVGDDATASEVEIQLAAAEQDRLALSAQVAALEAEVGASKDRFLRLNADFDNFRKRSEREKVTMATQVRGKVVEELLPMVDNFERAKTAISPQTEGEQKIDNSYQGIYKQFVEAMKALGVTAIETLGKEFDPMVHEAIMREESTEYADGLIVQEFRKGFMIGEKLLRPSMVKVSSGPGPSAAAPASSESVEAAELAPEAEEKAAA